MTRGAIFTGGDRAHDSEEACNNNRRHAQQPKAPDSDQRHDSHGNYKDMKVEVAEKKIVEVIFFLLSIFKNK